MQNKILDIADKIICTFFCLEKRDNPRASTVELYQDKILISVTEYNSRRHLTYKWDDFKKQAFSRMTDNEKTKLGIAMGKSIASNLVIDFKQPTIKY